MPELSEAERAWWVRPEEFRDDEDPLAHEKLHAVIQHIERNQDRKKEFLLFGAMYGGGIPPAGGGMGVDQYTRSTPGSRGNLSLNVTRNVVDAVTSRIFAKAEPKLTYVTEGGGYEKQENAKKLELGVTGAFYQTDSNDKHIDCGRDGCVFGTGATKTHPDWDLRKPSVERWMPYEVIFDDGEALYGEPRSLYTARYYDKFVLADRVKKGFMASAFDVEDKLNRVLLLSGLKDEDAEFGYQQVALRVRVEEAWHRPSGKDAPDGRHIVAVSGCTLLDEPWDGGPEGRPWPFAFFRWSKPIVGFYGQGIVELGSGIQAEINKIVRQIQNGHHLINGKWLVEKNSDVVSSHINNDLSAILKWRGTPPQYVAPAIIAPEIYSHLWALVAKYYEITGVNQQTAQAQKPEGLKSGEAQRVYADQQTETLLEKGKRFERYVRECGQLMTDTARALSEKGAYEVRAFADDGFETIDWKELDDPDGYELRVHPTSNLPGTPSGKIDLAMDLMQIGDFDPVDLLEIVGMPDMLQKTRLRLAAHLLVEKKIGLALREGEVWEPSQTLVAEAPALIVRATQHLHMAELKGVPDDRLQLVRDLLVKLAAMAPAAPPAAPQPGPQAAPGAPPMAAPANPTVPQPMAA